MCMVDEIGGSCAHAKPKCTADWKKRAIEAERKLSLIGNHVALKYELARKMNKDFDTWPAIQQSVALRNAENALKAIKEIIK